MISGRPNNGWVIWFSLTLALLLSVAPMPGSAEIARPLWLGLVIAFWSLTLPHRGGLGAAFCFGLAQDVLAGTLFGQSALPLILIAFLVLEPAAASAHVSCGSRAWCCWSCLASRSWSSSGSTR